jgi:3-oxoacyl-(acyl-carrier-protein) synthase
VVTTRGSGVSAAWAALTDGSLAGREWQSDGSERGFFAAPLPDDYRAHPGIPPQAVPYLDRGAMMALDAALQAVASAGLGAGAGDARRFGLADGLASRAPGQPGLFVPYGHTVARALGTRGPVVGRAAAEASGLAALAEAARLVAENNADVVIAVSAQALQGPLLQHLDAETLLAGEPARPFDERHHGCVPAEAAACLVVEAEEHASARGAPILARIAGAAETFDPAADPLAVSDAAEAGRTVQAALARAGMLQDQVDLIVSCADGRPAVDFAEGYGIRRIFGRHADYAATTALAGALGSALAAGGLLSVVLAIEAMRRGEVFPIAGFERPERDLDLAYVTGARAERLQRAVVTALGRGGTNVAVALERTA